MDPVRRFVKESPFARELGAVLRELSGDRVRIALPYSDRNANPGRALHGGCAASLAALGAQAVTRAALGPESGPWHLAELQVSYLAAAIGEDVHAEARLLRRGKALCFAEVDVATAAGKSIAHATAAVRARFGAAPAALPRAAGDDAAAEPGRMGPHIEKLPFLAACGVRVEHMAGGRSRLTLPARGANLDAGGGIAEGALLALLDTTGAMAAWAETGPGKFQASTPALQAQVLAPPPAEDLVAFGRVAARDGEIFWSDVEVAAARELRLVARGTVLYRIVT